MENNLLHRYEKVNGYYRYKDIKQAQEKLIKKFTFENAKEFISKYFKAGGKEAIFENPFENEYNNNGKHQHTVSLFFLGLTLKKLVENRTKSKIEEYAGESLDDIDFTYIWFLTCLSHDLASVIESENNAINDNNSDLDFYLGDQNILYNVYEHKWKNGVPYNYSKEVIKNYFKYRVKEYSKVDHGIIGGYLLYDKLKTSYDKAYEKSGKTKSMENFSYNGLNWKNKHHHYYAYASHAVIGHNIWFSENIDLYKKYGLTTLIQEKGKDDIRISIDKQPLLFFLGLLDTIEPFKRFLEPKMLKLIDISLIDNDKVIQIEFKSDLKKQEKYKNWSDSIYTLKNWLKLEITPNENDINDKIKIKIV